MKFARATGSAASSSSSRASVSEPVSQSRSRLDAFSGEYRVTFYLPMWPKFGEEARTGNDSLSEGDLMTADSKHAMGHLISLLALDCRSSGRDDLRPFLENALRALDQDDSMTCIKDAYMRRDKLQDVHSQCCE